MSCVASMANKDKWLQVPKLAESSDVFAFALKAGRHFNSGISNIPWSSTGRGMHKVEELNLRPEM